MKQIKKTDSILLFDNTNTYNNTDDNNVSIITNYYWAPNSSIIRMIEEICITNKYEKVLEIGPGQIPFSLATDFIGSNETVKKYINIDIDKDKFPYDNNSFDFIFCRHVLEDIQNPDFALQEIFRVSKCG